MTYFIIFRFITNCKKKNDNTRLDPVKFVRNTLYAKNKDLDKLFKNIQTKNKHIERFDSLLSNSSFEQMLTNLEKE